MNNSERKNKRRRFLALILAVALIFGNALIINTAYAQSSTGSDDGANLSLYKAAGITYHKMTSDHNVTPVTPTYYTLYSIKEVPSEGYFKVETKIEEIEKELPTTATLVLNSTGSYTRTTAIKWTLSSATNEKVTFAGKVSLPYDVVNPKGISLDLVYTAIFTNKKPVKNAMIIFEDDIEDEKTANMFALKKTYTYEGAQICPKIRQVYWDGDVKEIDDKVKISFFTSVFTEGYTVTYGENKEIGKGTVTLTPNENSNFIGSVTREFDIVKGEKLEVTYQKKDNYTYYPAADKADELSFRPDIKETPDRLSYKVTYDGSKVTSNGNKAKNVAEAIAMVTMDADGFIHVKREIPHGDYNITFTSPNFKESGKFCIHVSEEKMKSVTYVLNGGSVYAKNEQGKEIEISRDRFVDYFKEDNLKNGAYIVRVGNSYKKYEYVVKKGNQDPDKGKVLKFRGWFEDEKFKYPFNNKQIKSIKSNKTLYAKFTCDSDLKVEKKEYTKYQNSKAFELGATCSTAIKYSSSDTKVCTVDSKGKVTIKGIGTATVNVKAEGNRDYEGTTISVEIKVNVKGPSEIAKIERVNKEEIKIKVSWKTVSNLSGYELRISTNKNFDKNVTWSKIVKKYNVKAISFSNLAKDKPLKVGKKYYFKLRGYIENGKKKVYSTWTSVKCFKVPKN